MGTALKHAALPSRDPFQPGGLLSLGKPGLADKMFRAAGFQNVASTALDAPFRLPSARHYLDFIRSPASPIQQIWVGFHKAQRMPPGPRWRNAWAYSRRPTAGSAPMNCY